MFQSLTFLGGGAFRFKGTGFQANDIPHKCVTALRVNPLTEGAGFYTASVARLKPYKVNFRNGGLWLVQRHSLGHVA